MASDPHDPAPGKIGHALATESLYRDRYAAMDETSKAVLHPRRKAALRGAAVGYCHEVGIGCLVSRPAVCAALVALARRCAKAPRFAAKATHGQIVDGEPCGVSSLRDALRLAERYGWIEIIRKRVSATQNEPNVYIPKGPLLMLARLVQVGCRKSDTLGFEDNTNINTSPTSQRTREAPRRAGRSRQSLDGSGLGNLPQRAAGRPPSKPRAPQGLGRGRRVRVSSPVEGRDKANLLALAGRGLAALNPMLDGSPLADVAAAVAAAWDTIQRANLPLKPEDLARACARRDPLWAVLCLAGAGIKYRTHSHDPIRDFGAYWGRMVYNPWPPGGVACPRDPVSGIKATVDGHLEAVATGEAVKAHDERRMERLRSLTPGSAILSVMRRTAAAWRALPEALRSDPNALRDAWRSDRAARAYDREHRGLEALVRSLPAAQQGAGVLWMRHYLDNRDTVPFPDPAPATIAVAGEEQSGSADARGLAE